MEYLNKKDVNFCENAGIAGLGMAFVCLCQHLYLMEPHWITFTMLGLYVMTIVSFIMLIRKSTLALLFLAISGGGILFTIAVMTISYAFSLVLVLLFLYILVIAAIGFSSDLLQNLKERKRLKDAEALEWAGKI
ncbi:MAG: hypothetical protein V4556_05845 [Bacteroidota bacterium]